MSEPKPFRYPTPQIMCVSGAFMPAVFEKVLRERVKVGDRVILYGHDVWDRGVMTGEADIEKTIAFLNEVPEWGGRDGFSKVIDVLEGSTPGVNGYVWNDGIFSDGHRYESESMKRYSGSLKIVDPFSMQTIMGNHTGAPLPSEIERKLIHWKDSDAEASAIRFAYRIATSSPNPEVKAAVLRVIDAAYAMGQHDEAEANAGEDL